MSVRRGPFKLKVQLPESDEDSESGSERVVSHVDANDSETSSDGSSGGREVGAKPKQKINTFSSFGSSGDEDSDVEEKQGLRNNNNASLSSNSDEESDVEKRHGMNDSADSNEEASDMEKKLSAQYGNNVSVSDSSDDDDSDGEVKLDAQSDSSANYSDNSDDEDSALDEKRSMQNDNNVSSSGSSSDEDSDVEVKQKLQHGNSASSSDSSSDEDSSSEEKHSTRNDKDRGDSSNSDSSSSGGSGEDSSSSDPYSSESEESESEEKLPPGKKSPIKVEAKKAVVSKTHTTSTPAKRALKRLRRPDKNNDDDSSNGDSSDEDSSDEDSVVAVDLPSALNSSGNQEDDSTESEREDEEEGGLDTDDEEDWLPRDDKEDKGDPKARRGKNNILGDSEEEWLEELDEVKPRPRLLVSSQRKCINDLNQAKYVMRNILSHVPLIEETAIRRGVKLSGPPLEFATTHQDEFARKFRWPQHFRNLRNRDFSQDPSEIIEDHELLSVVRQTESESSEEKPPKESPFAQVPRPMVSVAAEALRRSLRKRRRNSDNEDPGVHAPSAGALLNTARVGEQFGDRFVESLLSANGKALQGIIDGDEDYDKRCWSSLPTKRKPIANWRFVLEHVRRTMGRSDHDDSVYPPMKQETLKRITKRLKTLYGYTTQHEEYDVFEDASPDTSNNSVDIEE